VIEEVAEEEEEDVAGEGGRAGVGVLDSVDEGAKAVEGESSCRDCDAVGYAVNGSEEEEKNGQAASKVGASGESSPALPLVPLAGVLGTVAVCVCEMAEISGLGMLPVRREGDLSGERRKECARRPRCVVCCMDGCCCCWGCCWWRLTCAAPLPEAREAAAPSIRVPLRVVRS
jgi:hypothetical protein